jgi:hypothetical protein
MDVYESGVCIGQRGEQGPEGPRGPCGPTCKGPECGCGSVCGPIGQHGFPGADWNDGKGGDRGIPGPDYGGDNAGPSKKEAHAMPWYVAHVMRQTRRQQRVN